MKNEHMLKAILVLFLQINPKPADQQFHALAYSLGVDKETLESISYDMLASSDEVNQAKATARTLARVMASYEQDNAEDKAGADSSEAEDVLENEYDPYQTSPQDLALNDGAPAGTSDQQGIQDSTLNDGVGSEDDGVDIDGEKDMLVDDGYAPKTLSTLKAASRLFK